MPARVISIPFLILTAIFTYLTLEVDESFSIYIIVFVILLAIIYTFSPQINWWWYSRNPPEIDQHMRNLLIQHHSFYNELSLSDKKRFRNRMALYTAVKGYRSSRDPWYPVEPWLFGPLIRIRVSSRV